MDRDEVKWLVNNLTFAFNQPEMDTLMDSVRLEAYGDVQDQLASVLEAGQIRPVYEYLRESFASPDVDLVEVPRGQWSSLEAGVSYIGRMGKSITKLRQVGRWWWFGDYELESLDGIQQIWKRVER
jgi:hypothetical protein